MAATHDHLRTAFHLRLITFTTILAVAIPYGHDVITSITKKRTGLTPYFPSVRQTTKVAPTL